MQKLLTMQEQEQLVQRGLATKKINTELGLVTYKYHRRVMYDYLWDKHPELFECRGHTYDIETGEIVVIAPHKSFNYLENGTWKDKDLDETNVTLYKKFNGFMLCVSLHKGELVYSTTGGTTGPYVEYGKEMVSKDYPDIKQALEIETKVVGKHTFLFEICHPEDLHIVHEEFGAYILGVRYANGVYIPFPSRKKTTHFDKSMTLREALKTSMQVGHEGFMCYEDTTGEVVKLKSPWYTSLKKLMRAKGKNAELLYDKPEVFFKDHFFPEFWVKMIENIRKTISKEDFIISKDQERRKIVEYIINLTDSDYFYFQLAKTEAENKYGKD